MKRRISLLALAALATACATAPVSNAPTSVGRYAMGTVLELSLVPPAGRPAETLGETFEELFALADRLEGLFTVYDENSDVRRLNARAGEAPLWVDPLVTEILSESIRYSGLTEGMFDVTLGPLVALWAAAESQDQLPSKQSLSDALQRVGPAVIEMLPDGRVMLQHSGAGVNLGGIAKGFALEKMLPRLRARGIENALLTFGQSSTWALGAPPGEPGWKLLVRGAAAPYLGVVTLRDQALSVSGSLGRFARIEGVEFGHVIDPRNGMPLTRRRQAVVVAPDAALAEALSKALLVGGEVEGLALVEGQPHCEGLLADAGGTIWSTSGWQEAVRWRALDPH